MPPPDRSGDVPVIATDRLTLRGHRVDDHAACTRLWADPEVVRYIGGRVFSAEESWAKLLRYAGLWSLLGFGYWAIEEAQSGRFVGELGFADFKREIEPSLGGRPELGWALASTAHGKGYATEAVRGALAWGDARFGATGTICLIHPDNAASLRVAAKAGYREWRRTTYKGQPTSQRYGGEVFARYTFPSFYGVKSDIKVAFADGDSALGYNSLLHDGVAHLYLDYFKTAEFYAALTVRY